MLTVTYIDAGAIAGATLSEYRDYENGVVIRHYGMRTPSAEVQERHTAEAIAALRTIGAHHIHVAHGITVGGGTPGHRWRTVAVNGAPAGLKVLASNEKEAERELDGVAAVFAAQGILLDSLSVIRPFSRATAVASACAR